VGGHRALALRRFKEEAVLAHAVRSPPTVKIEPCQDRTGDQSVAKLEKVDYAECIVVSVLRLCDVSVAMIV
jgi:hypothetical protein